VRHRLVFGMASAKDAALDSGRSGTGAESLGKHKGDGLHITEHKTVRVAVALVRDEDLGQAPRHDYPRPWLSGASTGTTVLPFPIVAPNGGGVLPWRVGEPTSEERAQIRQQYAQGMSINKISEWAWGKKKMPTTYKWIRQALSEGGESEVAT
jgi:hypothetical protein